MAASWQTAAREAVPGGSPGDPAPRLEKEVGLEVPPCAPLGRRAWLQVHSRSVSVPRKGEKLGFLFGKIVQLDLQ